MEGSENAETIKAPTNGDIFEIVNSLKRENDFGVQQFNVSFKQKFPRILQVSSKPKSLHIKAERVYRKVVDLKRNKKISKAEEYFKLNFELPKEESNNEIERALSSVTTEKEKKLVKELSEEKQKSKNLKRQIAELEKVNQEIETNFVEIETQYFVTLDKMQNMNVEMGRLLNENQECASNMSEQYNKLRIEYEQHQAELDKVEKKLTKCRSNSTTNLNKKIKYRDSKLEKNSEEIKKLKEMQKSLQAQLDAARDQLEDKSISLDSSKSEVEALKYQKRQLQYKVCYLKRKVTEVSTENTESACLDEIADLQKNIEDLNRENKELQELICLLQDEEIIVFQNGRYCDDLRETIMELLNMNVSMNKVNDVIKLVLKNLAGKEVERLPSNAVKSRLLIEARHLAHVQVIEAMNDAKGRVDST